METSAGLKKSKTRETNIELLRIIAMMMIVAHHYMWHGEALKQNTLYSVNWFFSWTIEATCIVAVNCYVLISSYFLVNSQFKINRLIKIWLQILFYSAGIYLVLVAAGFEPLSVKNLVTSCLPIMTNRYWFATVYIALYIFSPFLNTLIHALSHKQMRNLVIILFAMLSIWPTILPFGFSLDNTNGYSIIQFVFLYFLGAYIRLHWNFNLKSTFYISFYALITILIICSKIVFEFLGFNGLSYTFFLYNSISVVLSSLMLFMFFKSISIYNASINRIINSVAVLTFGVYLIHDNFYIRNILYKNILHTDQFWNTSTFIPVSIISVFGVFVTCISIDAIRKKIFGIFEHSKHINNIGEHIGSLALKLSNLIYNRIVLFFNSIAK